MAEEEPRGEQPKKKEKPRQEGLKEQQPKKTKKEEASRQEKDKASRKKSETKEDAVDTAKRKVRELYKTLFIQNPNERPLLLDRMNEEELERYFGLDKIGDYDKNQLKEEVRALLAWNNAWVTRVDNIERDPLAAIEGLKALSSHTFNRLYEIKGAVDAEHLLERYAQDLLSDADKPPDQQKYTHVLQGDRLSKYHNQDNWNQIKDNIVQDLIKEGLTEEEAKIATEVAWQLWKTKGRFAMVGAELAVSEEEEKFYGGGFEYQFRRILSGLAWAKREGAFTEIFEEAFGELKKRYKVFRLTENILGVGDLHREFTRYRIKDEFVGREEIRKQLEDLEKSHKVQFFQFEEIRGGKKYSWWEIDIEKALIQGGRTSSLEWLPHHLIDYGKLERGEKGAFGAWLADLTDANELRSLLFARGKTLGVAWILDRPDELEKAMKLIADQRAGAHLAPGEGRGAQYDFQGIVMNKISERVVAKWEPRDNYREFNKNNLSPAIDNGLFEQDVRDLWMTSVAEFRNGESIDATWIAKRLLAIHDEDTLRAFFASNEPDFMDWLRRVALGEVETTTDRQKFWLRRLADVRHRNKKDFHYKYVRLLLEAKIGRSIYGYEAQRDFLASLDNLTVNEEWKLLFVNEKRYGKDILTGQKTVNRALAEGLISERKRIEIESESDKEKRDSAFWQEFLEVLEKSGVLTVQERNFIGTISDKNERNRQLDEILNKKTGEIFAAMGQENLIGRKVVEEDRLLATIANSYQADKPKNLPKQYIPYEERVDIWPNIVGDPVENFRKIAIREDRANPRNDMVERHPTREDLKTLALMNEAKLRGRTREIIEALGWREIRVGPLRFWFSWWDVKNFALTGGKLADFDRFLEERMGKGKDKIPPKLMPIPKLNPVDFLWVAVPAYLFFGGPFNLSFWSWWWSMSALSRFGISPGGFYRYLCRAKFVPSDWNFVSSIYKEDPKNLVELSKEI